MPSRDPLDRAYTLYQQGKFPEAEALLRSALRDPANARAAHLMGLVQHARGRLDAALYHAARAADLNPADIDALGLKGMCLVSLGRAEEGLAAFDRIVAIDPRNPAGHNSRGLALLALGRPYAAAAAFHAAVRCFPSPSRAGTDFLTNLVLVLNQLGRADEALELLRPVLAERPRELGPRLAFAAISMYSPALSASDICAAHRAVGELLPAATPSPHPALLEAAARSAADPDRRLRVAFLSADMRAHSVACFLLPILEHLDRARFEVACFHLSPAADDVTARCRRAADLWRDAALWDDEHLAHAIRADRIDILVELGGHTSGSRITALRSRPAALQVNYLGYAATTGLPFIDARIVDETTDPPGAESESTEHLLRLPLCFLCYRPPDDAPPVAPRADGPITFGSFNNGAKVNEATVALWSAVLAAVPDSLLLLKAQAFTEPESRRRFAQLFAAHNIAPGRIDFAPFAPSRAEHLALYSRVDIALDTFPYHGTTTTCEALHMGVPVVSLRARTHAGRVGASLLAAAGLHDLVAASEARFVEIAAALARRTRLAPMRRDLRERLAASPLRDEPAFAARFGDALRREFLRRITDLRAPA